MKTKKNIAFEKKHINIKPMLSSFHSELKNCIVQLSVERTFHDEIDKICVIYMAKKYFLARQYASV